MPKTLAGEELEALKMVTNSGSSAGSTKDGTEQAQTVSVRCTSNERSKETAEGLKVDKQRKGHAPGNPMAAESFRPASASRSVLESIVSADSTVSLANSPITGVRPVRLAEEVVAEEDVGEGDAPASGGGGMDGPVAGPAFTPGGRVMVYAPTSPPMRAKVESVSAWAGGRRTTILSKVAKEYATYSSPDAESRVNRVSGALFGTDTSCANREEDRQRERKRCKSEGRTKGEWDEQEAVEGCRRKTHNTRTYTRDTHQSGAESLLEHSEASQRRSSVFVRRHQP